MSANVDEAPRSVAAEEISVERTLDELDTGMGTLDADSTIDVVSSPSQDPHIQAPLLRSPPPSPIRSCAYINVEHDQSRVFVVGQTMNFRFSLTPLMEGLSDVFIAVEFEGRGQKVEVRRLGWVPLQGERRELKNLNFAAPEAGSMGFSFYFGFTLDGIEHVLEADGEHKVWPSHARATDVVRNLEINIQNSGHATDINLSGIKEQLSPDEKLEDVIDRLHRMPPMWSGLRLYGSNWRPPRARRRDDSSKLFPVPLEGFAPFAARVEKLTLRTDGRIVHLLSGDTLRLGKNRQNDIVTRMFEAGKTPAALNSKISRHHCIIERQGKHCYIVDRGDYPGEGSRSSVYGVFVDGDRVPPRGRRELETKSNCRITLAGSEMDSPGIFSLELEPWRCDPSMRRSCRRDCEARKLGSLVLRRRDCVPETYIAVWECFSLGEADPDFDGIVVWREVHGYGYATANTEGWLEPGMVIQTPQGEVRVEEWNQHGL